MWSFEGDFRTKPTQSLRGASKQEQKASLIKRAQEERQKREQLRLQNACATKIQSMYRGYRDRKEWLKLVQKDFDAELQEALRKSSISPPLLSRLLQKLLFFFRPYSDGQRLVSFSQQLLKQKDEYLVWVFQEPPHAIFQIKKLLELHMSYLICIVDSLTPIAVPMRMLEMFISPAVYDPVTQHCGKTSDSIVCLLLKHLIKNGYFECMRDILNKKVPSSLERSPTPPTPVAASVLDLIMSPISFATATADRAFSRQVMLAVCQTLLCPSFSEQVAQFLLPAMAYGKYPFPFVELIQALITHMSDTAHSAQKPASSSYKLTAASSSSMTSTSSKSSASPDNTLLSPCMLYAILVIGESKIGHIDSVLGNSYLELLRQLLPHLPAPQREEDGDSDSDEEDQMVLGEESGYHSVKEMREKCIQVLDSPGHLKCILTALRESSDVETIERIASICHTLMFQQQFEVHRLRLLYTLAFNMNFMRSLWQACTTVSMQTVTGSSNPLLNMLSSGLPMAEKDLQKIAPLLSTFCSMFSYSLLTLHDADFYGDNNEGVSSMPFTLREMVPMSLALRNACLGIIELAHPDAKVTFNEDYSQALHKTGIGMRRTTEQEDMNEMRFWDFLFKVISTLVKQIYSRDGRRPFCREGHWLSPHTSVQLKKHTIHGSEPFVFIRRPFADHTPFDKLSQDEKRPPMSNREVRNMIILTELPFVVSFEERVKTLQALIHADKDSYQEHLQNFNLGQSISVKARRPYIYEDAFDNLSPANAPNLKLRMRVQLINAAGLDEVGIDGGGIFREFLTELLKAGFDPNRGFFKYTADRQLYPNAQASMLEPNFRQHFYFLGRMLGKALLENMLVELPFASFFLAKILSQHSANLDIHHLQSMDPIMYKNLLFVKNYEGDVSDLGLDFTVISDYFGETKVCELKRGGRHIAVTKENRIEYIHLMADYLLNRQTRQHCASFRDGVANVIKLDWLQMFSSQELQVLISGAAIPIDIADLKRHTSYSGGYTDSHPVIVMFWEVVSQFTDKQKRQLLKFVTSCSRAPLLGFKDLHPEFCIHSAGPEDDRLPTASTCMNLLKLPDFPDATKLREKLLYAIESGAGFELS